MSCPWRCRKCCVHCIPWTNDKRWRYMLKKYGTHSGYWQPETGLHDEKSERQDGAVWLLHKRQIIVGFVVPSSTYHWGAAVNVAKSVLIFPVAVYVGSNAICAPEKEGKSVGGGRAWEDVWAGITVPAPGFKSMYKCHAREIIRKAHPSSSCLRVGSIKYLCRA
jgi:hypothetical protein